MRKTVSAGLFRPMATFGVKTQIIIRKDICWHPPLYSSSMLVSVILFFSCGDSSDL